MTQLRADGRILLLAVPSTTELTKMARVLMNGVVVSLSGNDDVGAAREMMAEFENVMFLDPPPDRIPWRAAFHEDHRAPRAEISTASGCCRAASCLSTRRSDCADHSQRIAGHVGRFISGNPNCRACVFWRHSRLSV